MLGIRRSGVTVALGMLTDYGLIEHARNRIVVLKPSAIKLRACDCYATIAAALQAFNAQLQNARPTKRDHPRGVAVGGQEPPHQAAASLSGSKLPQVPQKLVHGRPREGLVDTLQVRLCGVRPDLAENLRPAGAEEIHDGPVAAREGSRSPA